MIKKILFSCALFFSFSSPALSTIVEHNFFDSILNYLNEDDNHCYTLIILDIDNTLAEPVLLIGSDQWCTHEMKKKMDEGLAPREAWLAIKDLYVAIQHAVDLVAIEEITPQIIKELQARGIMVVMLTARLPELRDRTFHQLKKIDIDLSDGSIWHEELTSDSDLYYHYKNGIIFCDGHEKAAILNAVLQRINYQPKKVIIVDDKEKYLHSVKKIFSSDVDFIGIRYSNLDEKVANYDAQRAAEEIQLIAFT